MDLIADAFDMDREAPVMAVVREGQLVVLVIGQGDGVSERWVLRPSVAKKLLIELFKVVVDK